MALALVLACAVEAKTGRKADAPHSADTFTGEARAPSSPPALWYRQPAYSWKAALPIGNGRLGAMVYGRVSHERICLNEVSLWSGAPINDFNPLQPRRAISHQNNPEKAIS